MRLAVLSGLLFFMWACSKDQDNSRPVPRTSESLGSWTVKGKTFTAISYRKLSNTISWYDVYDMFLGTDTNINNITIFFSKEMPTVPGNYEIGMVQSANPSVERNHCKTITAGIGLDLSNPKFFTTPAVYRIPWGTATVTVQNGKHFMTIPPITIYQVDQLNTVIDSTSLSTFNLEY
ncbi:MAG TPA: hypothetical protein VLC28_08970 [Flavitalea sp.]|nr:hypothetical protein [Flavitalea sp.]